MKDANDDGERKIRSLRDLPQEIQPPRDLWAGIQARISAEQGSGSAGPKPVGGRSSFFARPGTTRWLALAAMIAALAVGVWIGRFGLTSGPRPTGPTTAQTSNGTGNLVDNAGARALQAAYMSDPKYRQERAALVKSLEAKLATLPPETREKVLGSLATIHKSMQDLEAALGKDPTKALLQELLRNTYQDEMRVLTTVHEASDAGKGI